MALIGRQNWTVGWFDWGIGLEDLWIKVGWIVGWTMLEGKGLETLIFMGAVVVLAKESEQ